MIMVNGDYAQIDGKASQLSVEWGNAGAAIAGGMKENNYPRNLILLLFLHAVASSLLEKEKARLIDTDASAQEIFDKIQAWVNEEQPTTLN